jgi:hypothetical protein
MQPGLPSASAASGQVQNLLVAPSAGQGVFAMWAPPTDIQPTDYKVDLKNATTGLTVSTYTCVAACLHHTFWTEPVGVTFAVIVTPMRNGVTIGSALTSASVTVQASAASAPPTHVVVTQDAGSTAATVSWTPATTGVYADNYTVHLYDGGVLAQVPFCSWCNSVDVSGLVPGHAYTATVTASNYSGSAAPTAAVPFQVTNPCAGTDPASDTACVTVNSSSDAGAMTHLSGILHGFGAPVPAQELSALNLNSWRISDVGTNYTQFDAANSYTPGHLTDVLSDDWFEQHLMSDGTATPPWQNWSTYQSWVTSVVNQDVATGHVPEYYDVMNEPGCCPGSGYYYNSTNGKTWTLSNMLMQYKVAYQAIQAAAPQAAAIGPTSKTPFTPVPPTAWNTAEQYSLDLDDFLSYAESNELQLPAVSWHEIQSGPDQQPSDVARDLQFAHWLIGQYADGNPKLNINEYAGAATYHDPGMIPSLLGAFEYNGVAEANRTTQTSTSASTYADLFDTNGNPTSVYWPYQFYGQMLGDLVPVGSTSSDVSGIAARATDGTLRLLLGRHANVTTNTTGPVVAGPATVQFTITVPAGTHTVSTAVVTPTQGATQPTVTAQSLTTDANGHLTLSLPAIADQSAIEVTVQP